MLSDALSAGTRDLHRQIESNPRMAQLMQPELTAAAYQELLERMYGFYRPLEAQLEKALADGSAGMTYAGREKIAKLEADLRYFGLTEEEIRHLPVCTDLPAAETQAEALGTLYVLEGATLGGKLIARRLRRQLGVTPDAGAAFYFSYGEDLGAMWKAFKAALNAHAARSEAPEDTYVTAARSTFLAMERWVSEPASHEHTRPAAG